MNKLISAPTIQRCVRMNTRRGFGSTLTFIICTLGFSACTNLPTSAIPVPSPMAQYQDVSAHSAAAIQITAAHLSAAGYMVDVRYRVLDAEKAVVLFQPKALAYLQEQASGAKLLIPDTAKLGLLRQKIQQAKLDRTYFMMFANPGKFVKPGDRVLLVMGDTTVGEVVIE